MVTPSTSTSPATSTMHLEKSPRVSVKRRHYACREYGITPPVSAKGGAIYTKRDKDYWTVGAWYFEVQKILQRRYYFTTLTSYANHFTCCILTPTSFIHSYPIYKRVPLVHNYINLCIYVCVCVHRYVCECTCTCMCVYTGPAQPVRFWPDQYL